MPGSKLGFSNVLKAVNPGKKDGTLQLEQAAIRPSNEDHKKRFKLQSYPCKAILGKEKRCWELLMKASEAYHKSKEKQIF